MRARYRRGIGRKKLVIIGDGAAAADCLERIRTQPFSDSQVIGSIGEAALPGLRRLGGYARLRALLDSSGADEAVIALDEAGADALGGILRACEDTGVKLALLPLSYGYMTSHPYIEPLAGLPLINVRRVALDDMGAQIVKRMMDVVGALLLIVLTSPLMLAATPFRERPLAVVDRASEAYGEKMTTRSPSCSSVPRVKMAAVGISSPQTSQ